MIEKRIINGLRRQLEEREFEIFKKFGALAELADNGNKEKRFNLLTSPDWLTLTKQLHRAQLGILESFSSKVLSKNYYEVDATSSQLVQS